MMSSASNPDSRASEERLRQMKLLQDAGTFGICRWQEGDRVFSQKWVKLLKNDLTVLIVKLDASSPTCTRSKNHCPHNCQGSPRQFAP
jgi:hypothetical protein